MQYKTQTVLLAAGTTALVVITVTLFTFWTKFDITQCAGIICILPLGMFFVWIFFFIPGVNVSGYVKTNVLKKSYVNTSKNQNNIMKDTTMKSF